MKKHIINFALLMLPMLAFAQYPIWTTNDLASPTGPAFSVPRGTQIRHTFTLTVTNTTYVPSSANSLRYEAVDEYDSEPIISTTVQVINATAAIYRVRWAPSISATYVASLNEYLPGTNGLAAILARNIVTVYAPTTGITVANNHPISVYANGPSNFVGLGGITGGITNGDIVIDGSDIAGTIGGATNVVPGDSFSYDASSRTLMVDTNQLGGSGGGGGDDTAELSNRVTAVEGYTNRAATALQAEADTAQTVFNRGHTVTGDVDFSASAGVRVPMGDMTPNSPITRADATQLVATVIVSGAVTRLIFESGSVMVTQIANAIEYNTNDYEGASVRTNADLIIVTPYPRRPTVGSVQLYTNTVGIWYTNRLGYPEPLRPNTIPSTDWTIFHGYDGPEDLSAMSNLNVTGSAWTYMVTNGALWIVGPNESGTGRFFDLLPVTSGVWSRAAMHILVPLQYPYWVNGNYGYGMSCYDSGLTNSAFHGRRANAFGDTLETYIYNRSYSEGQDTRYVTPYTAGSGLAYTYIWGWKDITFYGQHDGTNRLMWFIGAGGSQYPALQYLATNTAPAIGWAIMAQCSGAAAGATNSGAFGIDWFGVKEGALWLEP